jgi:protein TonB
MLRYAPARLTPSSWSSRSSALALTILAHILLLLLLLTLAPPYAFRRADPDPLKTFNVAPVGTKAAPKTRTEERHRAAAARPKPPTIPPPPIAAKTVPLIPGLENFDLRNVHSEVAQADTGDGKAQDSKAIYGPGAGPGGARLYNAEWYREPTDAELATYMPPRTQTGWGMIACQTVERYHVDNCRALGDDPPGSGLAQAIRKAAWQFLVRPPRIDGKPIIGAWVRIRIEITPAGAVVDKSRAGAP